MSGGSGEVAVNVGWGPLARDPSGQVLGFMEGSPPARLPGSARASGSHSAHPSEYKIFNKHHVAILPPVPRTPGPPPRGKQSTFDFMCFSTGAHSLDAQLVWTRASHGLFVRLK